MIFTGPMVFLVSKLVKGEIHVCVILFIFVCFFLYLRVPFRK